MRPAREPAPADGVPEEIKPFLRDLAKMLVAEYLRQEAARRETQAERQT